MIRQRALAWAAVLALVATVQTAPLPLATRFSASVAALAQDDSAADAGEPTDLAIVALHCAEAPATEALTSFFSSGTPPSGCAPAVGVAIDVTENEDRSSAARSRPTRPAPSRSASAWAPRSGQGRPEVAAVRVRAPHSGGQRRSLRQPGAARPGRGRSRRALRQCAGLGRRHAESSPCRGRRGRITDLAHAVTWTGRDAIRPTLTSARASHRVAAR